MATKKKLKKLLKKQRINHMLEMSDLKIELDKIKYELDFANSHAIELEYLNDRLHSEVEELKGMVSSNEQASRDL